MVEIKKKQDERNEGTTDQHAPNITWMKIPINRRRFIQGMGLGALALTGAGFPKVSWGSGPKVLKVREYLDMSTWDPGLATSMAEENMYGAVMNKLTYYKPGTTWGWEKDAAASIKQVDPTHIAFELKPGIMFSNGFGEMTAEDVKISFERIIDPALSSPQKDDWGSLDHVKVNGKYAGEIVLTKPFEPMWMTTLPYIAGNILSKKGLESAGKNYGTAPPCFSGPYSLKEWKPKQHSILTRNPVWKGPKQEFDEIHVYPIEDEKSAEMAFEAGDVDFTRISISSYARYKNNPPKNSSVAIFPSLYNLWLGMNVDNPKMQNKKLRQAIQMAVDVPAILDAAYSGAAEPSTGFVCPGFVGHREKSLVPPAGNISLAKKLMDEAGYPDGIDLTLIVQNKTVFNTAAQVIQANLAQIGVRIKIDSQEGGSFWTVGSESAGDRWKDIELILTRFSTGPDPYYMMTWYICKQKGVWNWMRYCDPEFDKLNDMASVESDQAKRNEYYIRMQDMMEESGAFKFITHEAICVMYRNNVVPALRPDGTPLLRYFKMNG